MGYKNTTSSLFKLLAFLVLVSSDLADSRTCDPTCGGISIPYPFGIGKDCYLERSYEIECRNTTTSRKPVPFLSVMNREVVSISLSIATAYYDIYSYKYGSVRVRIPITSSGCSIDGKDSAPVIDLTGTPFFIDGENRLVAVGCSSKVSLTHIKPTMVGCEVICNASKDSNSITIPFIDKTRCSSNNMLYISCSGNNLEEAICDGNRCCEASLNYEPQQVIGIKIESNSGSTTICRVAFLTDEVNALSNATKPEQLFAKGLTTVNLGWAIQTKNKSFINSLECNSRSRKDYDSNNIDRNIKCICDQRYISEISYANCRCVFGYEGNPYVLGGCKDINECKTKTYYCSNGETCKNTPGSYHCVGDKTIPIMIGVGAGFGVLVMICGIWWLRKFLIKRKLTKMKKKFFKRNGGLLLQKELNIREDNAEKTRVFSSKELEKATENFSENRVLGHGGQGTVYKGMLVDGRTVAVKKSKVIDEDKLQEFINEVVILSQINHRHVVKLLGCCLETEVPILVYEFILNGNLYQHIHEESDDYTMIWGMRLRIAVDIAGALSYLHTSASSPIYHRDIKSANILLDEKYRAKVSDFGTSRSVTIDQTHWTTVISGTVGYVDPEYYRSSQYTEKSDVYSFGVVLAELITGKKPVIALQDTQEIQSLAEHFKDAMKEQRFFEIIDARIRDNCKPEQVMAVANLAIKCLRSKGKNRPNMREVFSELEKICISPEASQVQIQIEEEDEDEDEEDFILNKRETWSTSNTAPALSTVASSSCSDVEPLVSRITW